MSFFTLASSVSPAEILTPTVRATSHVTPTVIVLLPSLVKLHFPDRVGPITAVYTTALKCVINEDLRKEWQEYLEQTTRHERIMTDLVEAIGLDPEVAIFE